MYTRAKNLLMDMDIRPPRRRKPARSTTGVAPTVAGAVRPPSAVPKPVAVAPPAPAVSDTLSVDPLRISVPRYPERVRPKRIIRKRMTAWGTAWRAAVLLLVVMVGIGGFLSWKAYAKLHKVFRGTSTVAALSNKPVVPDSLKTEGDGRVNILLLGVGGPGHDGPDLTDTIVFLSVDPVNNTAAMLSVPRDLWVEQPINYFGRQQKINAAYESGKYHTIGHLDPSNKNAAAVQAGFANIDQVLGTVLQEKISYHVLVDFQAFRQAVDTVGGVTVNVPTDLVDPTMAWENHWNPVLAKAGVQQMNGVQALLYARSRETTSDFARSQRQRQILVALKDKALTLGTLSNPAAIDGLLNAFGDNVYSDMSTQAATKLYGIMKKINDTQIGSIGLTDEPHKLVTTDHVGTTSVVRPVAGFDNYTDIQAYVRSQLLDGYIVKEHAPITVLAPTDAGAQTTAGFLKSYGYNVTTTAATTAAITTPTVVDLSHDTDPFTLHYLQVRFGVKAVTQLPAGVTLTDPTAKFVIMVPK